MVGGRGGNALRGVLTRPPAKRFPLQNGMQVPMERHPVRSSAY